MLRPFNDNIEKVSLATYKVVLDGMKCHPELLFVCSTCEYDPIHVEDFL